MKTFTKILGRLALVISILFSVSTLAAEKVNYYHWDATGSPVAATDEQGNVVWRKSYKPYGEEIQTPPTPAESRSFTGHVLDTDTGLLYTGARYYDPTIGRFMAVDPASFTEKNIHSFNRYAYGNNNPYRYVDTDGRFPIDTVWDAGNVAYDAFTGNWGDLAADLGALAIPYVPAGVTKIRHLGDLKKADGVVEIGRSKNAKEMASDLADQAGSNRVSARTAGGKQVDIDLKGQSHWDKATKQDIETPHVRESKINVGPNGKTNLSDKTFRPATKDDVRTARKILERQ